MFSSAASIAAISPFDGAPSRLIRATAASASSKMMFSVSRTLIPSPRRAARRRGRGRPAGSGGGRRACASPGSAGEVHDVRDAAGLLERPDDPDGLGRDRLLRLVGGRADVVRAVDAGQLEDRQAEVGRRGRRLVGEDVEPDADPALADGRGERLVVHDLGARRVDEERTRTEMAEELGVDQPARLRRERDVDAQDVGPGGNLRGGRGDRDPRRAPRLIEAEGCQVDVRVGLEAARPGDDVHAEGLRARASSWAMLPNPRSPSVRPLRPAAFEYSFLFQRPARSSATLSGIRRSSARISPKASSATAMAFLPGQFET